MWTRKELKAKGKAAFKNNYWKTVLVSLMMLILIGGSGGSGGRASASNDQQNQQEATSEVEMAEELQMPEINAHLQAGPVQIGPDTDLGNAFGNMMENASDSGKLLLIAGFLIIFLVLVAIALAIEAFVINPLSGGFRRFFVKNLNEKAELKELAYCYDHGYLSTVKTLFLRDIYLFFWFLLLLIPGVIKSYEYRMIPYIVAEHPEMPAKEVFARSRQMMRGQKWNAFVLDLSFIGWELLSLLTAGVLLVFYVKPYKDMTDAALYEQLAYVENN